MNCSDDEMKHIFAGLIREKLGLFRTISARIVHSAADADDAVQNALLKAWNKRRRFRGDAGALAGWVSRIVVTESYDLLRKRMREQRKIAAFEPEEPMENPALEKLDRAIALLPELYRKTMHIAILSGVDTPDAAKLLNCSENTLYQRIYKAKALLKSELGRMEHE